MDCRKEERGEEMGGRGGEDPSIGGRQDRGGRDGQRRTSHARGG